MQTINEKELLILLGENPSVVVYLTTPFCGVCQSIKPMITILAEALDTSVFVELNLNLAPAFASTYEITGAPTLVQFHNGQLHKKIEQLQNLTQLFNELSDVPENK